MEEFISWAVFLLGRSQILLLSHSSCQVTPLPLPGQPARTW